MPKLKKKRRVKRKSVDRPIASGTMSPSEFHTFIMNLLRKGHMRWRPKYHAIDLTFVEEGKNPKTGHKCKLHYCKACEKVHAKGDMRADHIKPVVNPHVGFVSWDEAVKRMFVEVDHYNVICVDCHKLKTAEERRIRKELSSSSSTGVIL